MHIESRRHLISRSGWRLLLLLCGSLLLPPLQTGAASSVFESKYTVCPIYSRLSGPAGLSATFANSTYIEISWLPLPSEWSQGLRTDEAQITVFVKGGGTEQNTGLPLSHAATRFGGLPYSSDFTVSVAVTNNGYVISHVSEIQLDNNLAPAPSYANSSSAASNPVEITGDLNDAFWSRDSASILQILQSGDYSNHRDSDSRTPLHIAAIRDMPAVAEYLLGLPGTDPNVLFGARRTPLHSAAEAGSAATAAVLLRFGADMDAYAGNWATPVHLAAANNHVQVLRVLLDAGAAADERMAPGGSTPLHVAIKAQAYDALSEMMRYDDYDLDIRNDEGWTPLHYVAGLDLIVPVRILLRHRDIDPNVQNLDGWTPLMSAAKLDFEEVAEALLDHRNTDPNNEMHPGFTALGIAIDYENEDIVELLLDHRDIDPNLGYPNGRTPLHLAALENNYDIAELLLDHRDTDPNTRDRYNQTALNIALYYGYDRLAELLEEYGGHL